MTTYLLRKDKISDEELEDDEWFLNRPELSWRIWCLVEAHGWEKLPFDGGLLDQPDWLMEDLATISWRKKIIEDMVKARGSTQTGRFIGGKT